MKILNEKNEKIQNIFLENIKNLTKTISTKVMLGDSTVVEQTTFDPNGVKGFYDKIIKNLQDWKVQNISISNNEDIRRIFTKFEIKEGNYLLSGHMSLQFHVLLYYKPDNRVIECQKELSEIIDKTKNDELDLATLGDQIVMSKLKELGYDNLNEQELFEVFYGNDELREKIFDEIQGKTDVNFQELSKKKLDLFNELDSYLLEIYQTTPILIDDTRLVAGEEGCLCTFDIEFIKNNTKEGLFDPKRIPKNIQNLLVQRLDQITKNMSL